MATRDSKENDAIPKLVDMSLSQIFEGLLTPWINPNRSRVLRWPALFEGANLDGIEKLTRADLADAIKCSTKALKNWEQHATNPSDGDIAELIKCLVQHHRHAWRTQAEFEAWRTVVADTIKARFREAKLKGRTSSSTPTLGRDALKIVEMVQLDKLPVRNDVVLRELWFGLGLSETRVAASELVILPSDIPLAHHRGAGLAHLAPSTREACESLSAARQLFVPHRIWVGFLTTGTNLAYRSFVYTDQPYGPRADMATADGFASHFNLGLGGLAAFMDPNGRFYGPTAAEPVNGWGCAAVIVAVAYRDGHPVSRSEAILVLRKGVLQPDDVFLKPNRRPFQSWPGNVAASRVLLQSKNERGGTSVYAMDFNGEQRVQLTGGGDPPAAWEYIVDEQGRGIAEWLPDGKVRIGQRARPGDAIEIVERVDPLWDSELHVPAPTLGL